VGHPPDASATRGTVREPPPRAGTAPARPVRRRADEPAAARPVARPGSRGTSPWSRPSSARR
jgi:hypothetical protein